MNKNAILKKLMMAAPVIPVIVIDDPNKAVHLARALVKGGLPNIEITLRTPRAIECIKAVADEVEGALAGAGTVLDHKQIAAVEKAGGQFFVSPGSTDQLLAAANDSAIALLAGAATSSDVMRLGEAGLYYLKFFPAEAAGGVNYLKSLASPFSQFKFCPTGGIGEHNAGDYLKLSNVLCVGGSWVAPPALIENNDWDGITDLAQKAAMLNS